MSVGDVTLTANGKPVTGMSVTYAVNNLPTCRISMIPSDIADVLAAPDAQKRSSWVVSASSISNKNTNQQKKYTLTFNGLLDGVSLSNTVGSVEYALELKSIFQPLTEAHTMVPGLRMDGMNPFQELVNSKTGEIDTFGPLFAMPDAGSTEVDPITYFKNMLVASIARQTEPELYINAPTLSADITARIWDLGNYKATIANIRSHISDWLDISTCLNGSLKGLNSSKTAIANYIFTMLSHGNPSMWEAIVSIAEAFNACLICSNNKIFLIPKNGFIKQDPTAISDTNISDLPNVASPGQCTNFSYNDSGYRDLSRVILLRNPQYGTGKDSRFDVASFTFIGSYPAGNEVDPSVPAKSAGTLVLTNHPFMHEDMFKAGLTSTAASQRVAMAIRDSNLTTSDAPNTLSIQDMQDMMSSISSSNAADPNMAYSATDAYNTAISDYAKAKFYAHKYNDRIGTITTDFNTNWVPGTCGTLYVPTLTADQSADSSASTLPRIYLQFFVTSVTHSLSMSAPNGGSASTTVTFSCGRIGANPIGLDRDSWFGYTADSMNILQTAYLKDIH